MNKILQYALLAIGVIAVIVLVLEIVFSIAATQPGSTPERVLNVNAGSYPLTVSFYKYPANAGFSLPFRITTPRTKASELTFVVTSVPVQGVNATPIRASLTSIADGVQGAAEITVRGPWILQVVIHGPNGQGSADVPVLAVVPSMIPQWLGWLIGFIPLYGLLLFLLLQRGRKKAKHIIVGTTL